jgi:hypothetical protein
MPTAERSARHLTALRDAHGYVVESPYGDVGEVEEVWLDRDGPCALAVRVKDGRRALLLDRDVVAVDGEHHWVVVPEDAHLLELDPPRLTADGAVPTASWSTTGNEVAIAPPEPATGRATLHAERMTAERPLWQMVAILYLALLMIVAFVIALVFTVAALA